MDFYYKYIKYKTKYINLIGGSNSLLSKYNFTKEKMFKKNGVYPHELTLYHATSVKNSKDIMKNGFDLTYSKIGAFGFGINLAADKSHLENYYDMIKNKYNKVAIITCKVLVYKSIENTSDITKLTKDGASKPKYKKTPLGYDSMYAMRYTKNEIWIIPTSNQVLPTHLNIIDVK